MTRRTVSLTALMTVGAFFLASCSCSPSPEQSTATAGTGGSGTSVPASPGVPTDAELQSAPTTFSGQMADDALGPLGQVDMVLVYDTDAGEADVLLDLVAVEDVPAAALVMPVFADLESGGIGHFTAEYGEEQPIEGESEESGPYRGSYSLPGSLELEAYDVPIPGVEAARVDGTLALDGFTLRYSFRFNGQDFTGGIDMTPTDDDFRCGEPAANPYDDYQWSSAGWSIGARYGFGDERPLPARARMGLEALGWTDDTWGLRSSLPTSYELGYGELDDKERFAADILCIDEDDWDAGALPVPTDAAPDAGTPTDGPSAPGTPTDPGTPATPTDPGTPANPGTPTTPTDPGTPTNPTPPPTPAPTPPPTPRTATVLAREACMAGGYPYLEVLFSVPAATPGASGVTVFTSDVQGSNPMTEPVQDSDQGPVLYYYLDIHGAPEVIGVQSVTIAGEAYTHDFGPYDVPATLPECPTG